MFDDILNKKAFVEQAIRAGVGEDFVQEGYKKLEWIFVKALIEVYYEKLAFSERNKIEDGLDVENDQDLAKLFERLEEFAKANPQKVDKVAVLKKALDLAVKRYTEELQKGVRI